MGGGEQELEVCEFNSGAILQYDCWCLAGALWKSLFLGVATGAKKKKKERLLLAGEVKTLS